LLETQVYFNHHWFVITSWFFQLSLLSSVATNYLNVGWEVERHGTSHASIVPYQAFTCQDNERIVVAAANDQFFKELCSVYDLNSSK
jgi:succinate--hydroxymethylglutarate CoA-transferase